MEWIYKNLVSNLTIMLKSSIIPSLTNDETIQSINKYLEKLDGKFKKKENKQILNTTIFK